MLTNNKTLHQKSYQQKTSKHFQQNRQLVYINTGNAQLKLQGNEIHNIAIVSLIKKSLHLNLLQIQMVLLIII